MKTLRAGSGATKTKPPEPRAPAVFGGKVSVRSVVNRYFRRFLTQFVNFILQEQFPSLHFMQFELVYRWVELLLLDFPLQRQMAAFEFGEMALQRHAQLLSRL
jgi:hypothetical protein